MENLPSFVTAYLSEGKSLLEKKELQSPQFSRGTYQIEVREKGKKKEFPFLQMKDTGEVTDFFCSCKESEKGKGCPHLAASYLLLFNGHKEPLHVRFKKSFWSRLFQMASKKHGYEPDCLEKEANTYVCKSKTKKVIFWIEPLKEGTKKEIEKIFFQREEETEETSIKFSNLPLEEIASYRRGEMSHTLRFELSFWSDLAKWVMRFDEKKEPYKITFEGAGLPKEVQISFSDFKMGFYISEVNWPWLIPSLKTVESEFNVFDEQDESIEKIEYDEEKKELKIFHREKKNFEEAKEKGIALGEWFFIEGKGFFKRRFDSLFAQEKIGADLIANALSQFGAELKRFLPIDLEPKKANYSLRFDSDQHLHIELYVFEPHDLSKEHSSYFAPWAYLSGRGFFLIEDPQFEEKEKVVLNYQVADFINKHRLWLHNFTGFQTHLGSLESHLTYHFSLEKELCFDAELSFPSDYEEVLSFDEWVYIAGQGFYMKKESQGKLPLHPGLKVPYPEISSFISSHKEDLEQVQNFFNSDAVFTKTGLTLSVNEEERIVISPKIEYQSLIDPKDVEIFGDYFYVKGRGFSEIPLKSRIPEKYRKEVVIKESEEASFLAFELEPLSPYILEWDARAKRPPLLKLKIRRLLSDKKKQKKRWLVDLVYESDFGVLDLFSIWDAFQNKKRHLFSKAGLISLKEARFQWIRQLQKKKLNRKKGLIRLSTIEWIRLSIFEKIEPPKGDSADAKEARKLFEELSQMESHRLLDISQLKSTLRPYQETGLNWLWFLYCHGLSGLLCDDMGLGKTHQAMALLAAISYEDLEKHNKYLVVCPTSVIYHWQELLKRFLPEVRVLTYYGLERSLKDFENYDLLLTSYGILRTGKDDLRAIPFEVAIFDEIQIAKNQASQTHKALRAIQAEMRLGLTGTPIENRLRELKSLFDVVLPFYLPQDSIFKELFIHPIEKHQDDEKKGLLSRLIKPFLLRRKKSEVLTDLPEKIEEIAYIDLSSEQKKLYNEVTRKIKTTVYQDLKDPGKPVPYIHVFSALSQLKQICNHPSLIYGDIQSYASHESGKWELFIELIQEARESGQKIVVFSQYLDMLAIIEKYLKKKGIGYASIKGSTRHRSVELKRFKEDPLCEVFVASLLAAGVGIDLTVASIVIHYDRWWNPAKENQATDRVHRIGQNRGVQVFKLVSKGTIEEHIHEMIERKKGLLEEIIGSEDQISYLSRDELIQVFEKMFQESH